jgi:hypothetical protein
MVFTIPLLRAVPPSSSSSSSSSRPSAASSRTSATCSGERRHLPDPDRVREVSAEEAGHAAEGELAHPFRSFGNLSMGVARVLRPPRIWAAAPWVSIHSRRGSLPSLDGLPAGSPPCPSGARGWLLRAFAEPPKDERVGAIRERASTPPAAALVTKSPGPLRADGEFPVDGKCYK